MAMHEIFLAPQGIGRSLEYHVAVVQDVATVRQSQGRMHVLLDDDDRASLLGDLATNAYDILHNQRRQSFERLVQENEPRLADERARDSQHLLLAAERSRPRLLRRSASRGNIS